MVFLISDLGTVGTVRTVFWKVKVMCAQVEKFGEKPSNCPQLSLTGSTV